VVAAAELCDELGMDTISAGNVISFAIELSERGLLSDEDTGGALRFGDDEVLLRLLKQIGYRQGIGDVLAEGVRAASLKLGENTGPYALHVKGVELPGYDPRGAAGMGLGYATAFRGADHIRAFTISKEVMDSKADRYSGKGKARLVKDTQDLRTVFDAAGLCVFLGKDLTPDDTAEIINAVTDFGYTPEELLTTGERIWNQERMLAVREGMGRADDVLPQRLMEEPLLEGPAEGHLLSAELLGQMLDEYYELRRWDGETGHPTPDLLKDLGIH
jgi:aldehyde:ferredoxin oxidoreductase